MNVEKLTKILPRSKRRVPGPLPQPISDSEDELDLTSDPELLPSPLFYYSRPTELHDLFETEIKSLEESGISIDTLMTRYHEDLSPLGRRPSGGISSLLGWEQYNPGTTVSVKPVSPSARIAVIIGIWTIHGPGFEGNGRVRVSLRWLIRRSELRGGGAQEQRAQCENELFLSRGLPSVISVVDIISPCTVLSISAYRELSLSHPCFFCGLSVDPEKRSFSELDWDDFRRTLTRIPTLPGGNDTQHVSQKNTAGIAPGGQRKRPRISSEEEGSREVGQLEQRYRGPELGEEYIERVAEAGRGLQLVRFARENDITAFTTQLTIATTIAPPTTSNSTNRTVLSVMLGTLCGTVTPLGPIPSGSGVYFGGPQPTFEAISALRRDGPFSLVLTAVTATLTNAKKDVLWTGIGSQKGLPPSMDGIAFSG